MTHPIWLPESWSNKPRADVADGSQSIYTRLTSRYRLTDAYPGAPVPSQLMRMSKVIHPITNMDDLLRATKEISLAKSLVAGGYITYHTVPSGKRWVLRGVTREATTGTYALIVSDGVSNFYLTATSAAASLFSNLALPLDTGWMIQMTGSGNAADTSIAVAILYEEEDAY